MTRTTALAGLVLATAAAFAGMRLAGEKSQSFQAAAHFFVGGLIFIPIGVSIGVAICRGWPGWAAVRRDWWRPKWWWFPAGVAFVLSAVELAAFLFLPK